MNPSPGLLFRRSVPILIAANLATLGLAACSSVEPQEADVGSASAAIASTPSDVGCIRITVTGVRTVVRTFDVTVGQSVILNLNGLPVGLDTFVGEAFAGACSAVTNTSIPTWISDPVSAIVSVSTPPRVALVFHPNGGAAACVDWEGDAAPLVRLTSITLDPEDATGATTNAPGAWSTGTGDPLSQVAVIENGVFVNQGAATGGLGEISLALAPGIHALTLLGNGVFPGNGFYGAVLFFDGVVDRPQIAVYAANATPDPFGVQPADSIIMCSPNGGPFFCGAPGSSRYTAADGTVVEVLAFTIDATSGSTDQISFAQVWANGVPDTTANLVLRVSPACP